MIPREIWGGRGNITRGVSKSSHHPIDKQQRKPRNRLVEKIRQSGDKTTIMVFEKLSASLAV